MQKGTKRIIASVAVTAIAIPLLWFGYAVQFERKLTHTFGALIIGSTEAELLESAGKPTYTTDGTRHVDPAHERTTSEIVAGCVREHWYSHGFIFIPSKWSFCFDSAGQLIHKYHWVSW